MKTATGLILFAVGAILAFAVTAKTSVFNLQVAGFVIMLVALAGLIIPRKGYATLSRRFVTRRTRTGPSGSVVETEETALPPYVVRNPGTAPQEAGLLNFPSIPPDPGVQEAAMGPDKGGGGSEETDLTDNIGEE